MIDTPVPPTAPTTTAPDLNSLLLAQLAPVATQAAVTAAAQAVAAVVDKTAAVQASVDAKHVDSLALISGLQTEVAANKAAIEAAVGRVGTAVITRVETDSALQKTLAIMVVGGILLGCLIVLVGYLTGNGPAGKIVAGVPAAIGALVLLMSRFDGLPLPVAKSATVPVMSLPQEK